MASDSAAWKDFFSDPSSFIWIQANHERTPASFPAFIHKTTGKALQIDPSQNPPWVQIRLKELSGGKSPKWHGHDPARSPAAKLPKWHGNDPAALLNLIKSCGEEKDLHKVQRVHDDLRRNHSKLFMQNLYLSTALITTYAKCGSPAKAQEVFEQVPRSNVVSWNALISGYVRCGLHSEAFKCFQMMPNEGVIPDRVTYISILKACGAVGALHVGEQIHSVIQKQELLQKDVVLSSSLVDMYAKCGALEKAQEVFQQISVRNVVSWTSLIAGYVQHGSGDKALACFKNMKDEGIQPNAVTFSCVLRACIIKEDLKLGEIIEAEVRKQGLLQRDAVLGASLVDMYAKCGCLDKAREAFEELPVRNVVSWTALMSGYVHHGLGHETLKCFQKMMGEGISPDVVAYICALQACALVGSLEVGESIAVEVRKQGLLRKDIALGATLVDMYAKCGALEKAREVSDHLPMRNVVSWTALIAGYVQHGRSNEAIECFKEMKDEGISPNAVAYTCILQACGIAGCLDIGKSIDAEIGNEGLLRKDMVLGTALVDMYAKCGALAAAREVFERLPTRNAVAWNALIMGYVQHRLGEEALECFKCMKDENVAANSATYNAVLRACIAVGSLEVGEDIELEIREQGLLEEDVSLGTTLVDMYAKCGRLERAREVFNELPVQDVVSWTSLMAGYAQLGQAERVLDLFDEMKGAGVAPNAVTFLVLLVTCSHAGLMERGERLFDDLSRVYGLSPTVEHYTCMIDLFSRAGHFDKAKGLLDAVLSHDRLPLYLAVLGACRKWTNVELGRWAFEQSIKLDANCGSAYVCMRNIYSEAGMQIQADEIETRRVQNNASQKPDHSSPIHMLNTVMERAI